MYAYICCIILWLRDLTQAHVHLTKTQCCLAGMNFPENPKSLSQSWAESSSREDYSQSSARGPVVPLARTCGLTGQNLWFRWAGLL